MTAKKLKEPPKYYGINKGPFWCMRSKARLASLLFIGEAKLLELSSGENLYNSFPKPKKNGGFRNIDAPRADLKRVQSRIATLLQRIQPPEYLFAPVAGRSYVDNAAHHLGAEAVHLLDIDDFFPSCTGNMVIAFFKRMQCAPDICVILKNIVTKDDRLPQGSPCSPILAYLCYKDMWDDIDAAVRENGCTLSVYADDLTISGSCVPEKLIWDIKQILHKHGHRYNIQKERSLIHRTAEITGVVLAKDQLRLPNRQHRKRKELEKKLQTTRSSMDAVKLNNQIRGCTAQARQVIGHPRNSSQEGKRKD